MSTARPPTTTASALTGRCTHLVDRRPFFIERGSTVQVRQRASREIPANSDFVCLARNRLSRAGTEGSSAGSQPVGPFGQDRLEHRDASL